MMNPGFSSHISKGYARHLNDFDLAANNGGWQWAASTGCDAQPYFRIFNPQSQSEKFDPTGAYIRKYVGELADLEGKTIHVPGADGRATYGAPMVNHSAEREESLSRYKAVSGK
jgi:deoxyribodipyrimidine photo-lyase